LLQEPLSVLYEDDALLAVDKPPGLAVEKTRYPGESLEELAASYLMGKSGKTFLGIIHRLDRPTAGVLLFARKPSVLKMMNRQLEERKIKKTYLAVLHGHPNEDKGIFSDYLFKDVQLKRAIPCQASTPGAREAILRYQILKRTETLSLARVELITGRYHQIRAQFATRGFPVAGDIFYGAPGESWVNNGIGLLSHSLTFIHPICGQRMIIHSPRGFDLASCGWKAC